MFDIDILYVIVPAAIFLIIIILVKFLFYPKTNKNTKSQTKEYLNQKFDDLLALRAILVIKKESGVLLYSYVVECDDDLKLKSPDFFSGVIHAIQNIGKEMGFKDQFSRLVYGNYQIISNAGQSCQAVLVSRTEPSTVFEDNLLLLVKAFEKKYTGKLRENVGYINSADYDGAVELVRDLFDTFYIENLNMFYNPEAMEGGEVSKLGKLLLDQAAIYYKKNNSVCLRTLFIDVWGNNIDDVQKKHTKDDIIQELYHLYKSNYFAFYNV
ncbi:MAG TPA: hypothetical protein VKM55_21540 [Candidatus Lokiarchaeia archaeon]|nr:hypothetical protein [Candidatus Lokiarchaeia archaeon]